MKNIFIYALIFALCLTVQTYKIGLIEYQSDQALSFELSKQISEFKSFPLEGIKTSRNFSNSPVTNYILAVPLLIFKNSFISAAVFINVLNSIAACLLFFVVMKVTNRLGNSLLIIFFYIFLPSVFLYSRQGSMLQFYSPLWIFFAYLSLENDKTAHYILVSVSYFLLININLSGIFLFAGFLYLLYVLFRQSENKIKFAVVTALIFAVMNIFYFRIFYNQYGVIAGNNNVNNISYADNFKFFLDLFNLCPSYISDPLKSGVIEKICFIVSIIIAATFFGGIRFGGKFNSFVSITFISAFALYFFSGISIVKHYYLVLTPFAVVLTANFSNFISKNKMAKSTFNVFFSVCIFFSLIFILFFLSYIDKSKGMRSPGFGIVYSAQRDMANELKKYFAKNNEPLFITSNLNSFTTLKYSEAAILRDSGLKFKIELNEKNLTSRRFILVLNRLDYDIRIIESFLTNRIIDSDPYYIYEISINDLAADPHLKKIFNAVNSNWYLNYILDDLRMQLVSGRNNTSVKNMYDKISGIELYEILTNARKK
ncbi:MAG TPA: hypothetical protein PKY81_03405 [bacterium]|nr:hypothetical protein [bacterium]HPN29982.1 hypothetical protein [bacterium]